MFIKKMSSGQLQDLEESQTILNMSSKDETIHLKKKKSLLSKLMSSISLLYFVTAFLIIFNAVVFCITVSTNFKLNQIQEEYDQLKHHVALLKYVFMDDELYQDLTNMDKEPDSDYYPDVVNDPDLVNKSMDTYFDDLDYQQFFDVNDHNDKPSEEETTENIFDLEKSELSGDFNRRKREVLAATIDGVPIIAESYAERKHRNKTFSNGEGLMLYDTLGRSSEMPANRNVQHRKQSTTHTQKIQTSGWAARTFVNRPASTLPDASPTPMLSRTSRVMHTNEDKSKAFKRVFKKSQFKSGNLRNIQELVENVPMTTQMPRRHRNHHGRRAHQETMDEHHGRVRHTYPVAHYYGDTSKYTQGIHKHYRGNSHLAHPEGHYIDWVASNWMRMSGMDRFFTMHDGVLTIREPGLYYIYAQIYYVDEHDINGYRIYKNNSEIAQCTTMTHSTTSVLKRNTCYTSTIEYLEDGDALKIRDIESMRYAFFEYGKSFFGVYKISDAKIK